MITVHRLNDYKLGNALFMLAAAIGHAKKHGFEFGLTEPWRFQNYFQTPLPLVKSPHRYRLIAEKQFGYYDLYPEDDISLVGYWQSPERFMHCLETIRHYFTPVEAERAEQFAADYELMIHIRLTDYRNFATYHTNLETTKYYQNALSRMKDIRVITTLLVSDNIHEAVTLPPFKTCLGLQVSESSEEFDFAMLTQAKRLIIANSSFSAFAAILNKNVERVIAPKEWFGPDGPQNWRDIYSPDWELV